MEVEGPGENEGLALEQWERAKARLQDPELAMLVLDEFTYLLHYGWLETEEAVTALQGGGQCSTLSSRAGMRPTSSSRRRTS
ncbi:cob(I)yrinic acid a,c-diamide adenosyltransferase [Tepidiforma flava]|uniref:Cob(I)yrinic acid a,c-diamide adenosyltransferase n=1 Tax=Tepidiforma flava TaxID=3004094 RepID=A0ABY7M7N7_9CHLR|nr:cob(I)yrinic acid a,c-diamide adenosyltransferase [Tepidiforma flava]WBL36302.1 cob(I)yrinic acid a,c-diamide adenosyltransferase [Tepidiforma flava]